MSPKQRVGRGTTCGRAVLVGVLCVAVLGAPLAAVAQSDQEGQPAPPPQAPVPPGWNGRPGPPPPPGYPPGYYGPPPGPPVMVAPVPPPMVVAPAPPPLSTPAKIFYAPFYAVGLVLRYGLYYLVVAPFEVLGRALSFGPSGGVDYPPPPPEPPPNPPASAT